MTCVLERVASAKTDEDAYTALEAWAKLKVVLILPTRGGRKKRESRMRTHRRLMLQWIAGNIEECWRERLRIEQERASSTKKGHRSQQPSAPDVPPGTRAPLPLNPKNSQIER